MTEAVRLLQEARGRERAQTAFYRALSGRAEDTGDAVLAERLNELLADEQHHLSRVTARLLELGERPGDAFEAPDAPALDVWETVARAREGDEVEWYEVAVTAVEDPDTARVFQEILDSERRHRDVLGGKWMSA